MGSAVALPLAWLRLANSNADAAQQLVGPHPRSAASRAYYAAFAAAHAVLTHLRPDLEWPGRDHLRHGDVPGELWWTLTRRLSFSPFRADIYRSALQDSYTLRRLADYKPTMDLAAEEVADALQSARTIVRLAAEVTR